MRHNPIIPHRSQSERIQPFTVKPVQPDQQELNIQPMIIPESLLQLADQTNSSVLYYLERVRLQDLMNHPNPDDSSQGANLIGCERFDIEGVGAKTHLGASDYLNCHVETNDSYDGQDYHEGVQVENLINVSIEGERFHTLNSRYTISAIDSPVLAVGIELDTITPVVQSHTPPSHSTGRCFILSRGFNTYAIYSSFGVERY